MIKVGDKFILHSENGLDYKIEVININNCREPSMKYAVDLCLNEVYVEDLYFVSDKFLNRCERVEE